jgi:glycosyltransferase involved in cell wall biosynthesis
MWKVGRWVPVSWLRRTFAVWRAVHRLHAERPFDMVSFADGYGEGFRYSFAPLAPFAVQLFGPATFVQRWNGRAVPPIRRRMENWIERRPAAHASLLISATRRFASMVADEWGLDSNRIRIIRNPLNLARFRPADPGAPRSSLRVLFAGHLQPLKGVRALTAAVPNVAAQHAGVEFVFVGNDTQSAPDGSSMRAWMERNLHESGVLGLVRFVDPIPQQELVARYQACTVFVLPSLNDVYPNAVLEAMACGRPCVVTDTVGAAELITEARAGLVVPPDDAGALAAAISEILAMSERQRDEMGSRGRQLVERVCATPVIAAQTIEAYRDVLSTQPTEFALGTGGQ